MDMESLMKKLIVLAMMNQWTWSTVLPIMVGGVHQIIIHLVHLLISPQEVQWEEVHMVDHQDLGKERDIHHLALMIKWEVIKAPHGVLIMDQDMILDIHPNLTTMALALAQEEVDSQEARQEIHHSLMVHMAPHMVHLMAHHMVPHMVILVILEVPTMANGRMVHEDQIMEIMDTETEAETIKETLEVEGAVALNRTGEKIPEEETKIQLQIYEAFPTYLVLFKLWMLCAYNSSELWCWLKLF